MTIRSYFGLFLVFLCSWCYGQNAPGIATGSSSGTYVKFGEDIAKVCKGQIEGIKHMNIIVTQGSSSNMVRLLKDRATHLAIMQHDVVLFYSKISKNKEKRELASKLRCVLPLYTEEVHIIVRGDSKFKTLEDLNGKKVAIGEVETGSFLTARMIDKTIGANWQQSRIGYREGIKALKSSKVDAVIYVAGYPASALKSEEGIKLLSVSDENIELLKNQEGYGKATIPTGGYRFHNSENIKSISVQAMLMTYDYTEKNTPEFARKNSWVKGIAKAVFNNLEELQENDTYHPKWKQVSKKKVLNYSDESPIKLYSPLKSLYK